MLGHSASQGLLLCNAEFESSETDSHGLYGSAFLRSCLRFFESILPQRTTSSNNKCLTAVITCMPAGEADHRVCPQRPHRLARREISPFHGAQKPSPSRSLVGRFSCESFTVLVRPPRGECASKHRGGCHDQWLQKLGTGAQPLRCSSMTLPSLSPTVISAAHHRTHGAAPRPEEYEVGAVWLGRGAPNPDHTR